MDEQEENLQAGLSTLSKLTVVDTGSVVGGKVKFYDQASRQECIVAVADVEELGAIVLKTNRALQQAKRDVAHAYRRWCEAKGLREGVNTAPLMIKM